MVRFRKLRAAAKSMASRVLEEVLPFVFYLIRKVKQDRKARDIAKTGEIGDAVKYHRLASEQLASELKKERERAKALDEKTFKMTLALGFGLAIVSLTRTFLLPQIPFKALAAPVGVCAILATFYTLVGGLLALGALRTYPTFGYGTEFLIKARKDKTHSLLSG